MLAGFLWGSLWVHNGDTTSHQLPQSNITLSIVPMHMFQQYWHDMPLLCVCVKKWDPLETHSVISLNSHKCMHSANSCIQPQWHWKIDPTSALKYKPVSVLACLLFAAYLFNAPDTIHHHCFIHMQLHRWYTSTYKFQWYPSTLRNWITTLWSCLVRFTTCYSIFKLYWCLCYRLTYWLVLS